MSLCSPQVTLIKSSNKKLPLIPIVKKFNLNLTEKFRNKRSFSPVIEKISKNNVFEEKINKLKEELIKFRKGKESEEQSNAKKCIDILDSIKYLGMKPFCFEFLI